MSNSDTRKAIEDNLLAILAAQGFNVEDSSSDPSLSTTPLAVLLQTGGGSDRHYGQNPSKGWVNYSLLIIFSAATPSATRDKVNEYIDKIRDPITITALNAGIPAANAVNKIPPEDYSVEYQQDVTTIIQPLTIYFGQPRT